MGTKYWQELVKRYANGRPICNCGDAYYSPCGSGIDSTGRERTDILDCEYGCSTNQISAKEDIAKRVLYELNTKKAVLGN